MRPVMQEFLTYILRELKAKREKYFDTESFYATRVPDSKLLIEHNKNKLTFILPNAKTEQKNSNIIN